MSKLHRNITGIAARASDSFNQTRMTRAALLASTALVAGFGFAASVSSPAHANTISAPGAIIFENDPAGIWINPTDTPTTVTVDTGIDNTAGGNLLGTLGNGVFFWNGVSPTTVNVSSGIIVTGDGLSLLS